MDDVERRQPEEDSVETPRVAERRINLQESLDRRSKSKDDNDPNIQSKMEQQDATEG